MSSTFVPQKIQYDPFDYEVQKDPYPIYRELREHAPLYYVEKHDMWALSRYSDVQGVIRDWRAFSNREGVDIDKTDSLLSPGHMDEKDGAEHDKYRRLVQRWFGPKQLRANIVEPLRAETSSLVAGLKERGGGNLVEEISWQLPAFVVTRMFDAPDADRQELVRIMKPVFARLPNDPVPPQAAFESGEHIMDWCRNLILQRRREDLTERGDILTMLMLSELDGKPLDDQQILGIMSHLIVASSGTTQDLISNAVWLLALHPGERAKLINAPDRIPAAVEECLRYEAVIQNVTRVANKDVEFYGVTVPEGATVVNLLGSANRDERKWDNPDRFDVLRNPEGTLPDPAGQYGGHLSFADGLHLCLGRPIARMEAHFVVEEMLQQMPHYELSAPPVRAVSHVARGFESVLIEPGQ